MTFTAARAADFFFHDGDQPGVFLGDSITQQKMYTTLIEAYVLSRYPTWHSTFRNLGWNGDRAGVGRVDRDVLPLHPAAITIDFGMNDARAGEVGYAQFVTNSLKLVQQLKANGLRVALLTPSPEERYDSGQPAGSAYNPMLWKYSQALQHIAAQENILFVDQYTPFVQAVEAGRKAGILSDTNSAARLIPDGVHPNWAGHLVMATAILKGLGATALVSRAELDAKAGKVLAADGCQIELLPADGGAIAFRRIDKCLPWFIPVDGRFVLQIPGVTALDDLSRYELRVVNLPAANYKLTIDNQEVGLFPAAKLATGVNLTLQAGPITAQAEKLFNAIAAKNGQFFQRWREVQLYSVPDWLKHPDVEAVRHTEEARLDAEIVKSEKAIEALRAPVPHVFKLTPAD